MKISSILFSLGAYARFFQGSHSIYSVHSPQAYRFCENVLHDQRQFYAFAQIKKLRRKLEKDTRLIQRTDFGAGSRKNPKPTIPLRKLVRNCSIPPPQGKLLFRLVNHYQPQSILELGTCLGMSTSYMASAKKQCQVYSLEGDPSLLSVAKENFQHLNLSNIELICGNIDQTLQPTLAKLPTWDMIFIDANHRYEALTRYWEYIRPYVHENSLVILDDIHWSSGMEKAWQEIQHDTKVTLSLDLFRLGLLFFNTDRQVQHLKIRA